MYSSWNKATKTCLDGPTLTKCNCGRWLDSSILHPHLCRCTHHSYALHTLCCWKYQVSHCFSPKNSTYHQWSQTCKFTCFFVGPAKLVVSHPTTMTTTTSRTFRKSRFGKQLETRGKQPVVGELSHEFQPLGTGKQWAFPAGKRPSLIYTLWLCQDSFWKWS